MLSQAHLLLYFFLKPVNEIRIYIMIKPFQIHHEQLG